MKNAAARLDDWPTKGYSGMVALALHPTAGDPMACRDFIDGAVSRYGGEGDIPN